MATHVGIGKSKLVDSVAAGKEAVSLALSNLDRNKPDMVFVYATFGYNFSDLIKSVKAASSNAFVIGGTVFGVIDKEDGGDTELNRVLVCAISSDDFKMTPFISRGLSYSSKEAGARMKDAIIKENISNIKGLYLVLDGLRAIDPDSMLAEVSKSLPEGTPVFGGSASEPLLWKNTYQFYDTEVLEDSVVGIVFSGDIMIDVTSSHGSQELGGVHTVTRAEGSRIFEIDNKPAMNLFTELYGFKQTEINGVTAIGVCLGTKIIIPNDHEEHLELRIPLSSNKDGSIVMAAAWPEGTKIYICQRDIELISKRNKEVIESLLKRHDGKIPLLVFESDCMGRSGDQIGKEAADKDVSSAIEAFPGDPLWFGAYLYGELASIKGVAAFHNWTGSFACIYVD